MFLDHAYWSSFPEFVACPKWYMLNRHKISYYRSFHGALQESKMFYRDVPLEMEYGIKLRRGKRSPYHLDPWNHDKRATCSDSKSWKKLYRVKKQWQKDHYYDEYRWELV